MKTENVENREDPCTVPLKDERNLLLPEVVEKAPYYVLRLMNGADVTTGVGDGKTVVIRSCGREYGISAEAYELYKMIQTRLTDEFSKMMGVKPPYNIEDINMIYYNAKKIADIESGIDASWLRVLFYKADETACWFYRIDQPSRFLRTNEEIKIHVESSDWLSYDIGTRYDMILFPRAAHPQTFAILNSLQEAKKIVIYETDDNLFAIPEWNPTFKGHDDTSTIFRREMMTRANAVIVSTEELAKTAEREEKDVFVCHNALDDRVWPMKPTEQLSVRFAKMRRSKIRIMWAGSTTHSKDLELLRKGVKRIVKEFPDTVQFVFVGALPDCFAEVHQRGNEISIGVDPRYANNIMFHPGTHMLEWPQLAVKLGCHIGLAPLVQHEFNKSKSEIKVLEYWAMGMAVLATNIAPYARAIEDGKNGILVKDDENAWYLAIRDLIASHHKRQELALGGLATLEERYLMKNRVFEYERALLTIARGKTPRRECNEMIEARLKEKGWA